MITTRIHCDQCTSDITHSHGYQEHRFRLEAEPRTYEGISSDKGIEKPLVEDIHHFCGWKCLSLWVTKRSSR